MKPTNITLTPLKSRIQIGDTIAIGKNPAFAPSFYETADLLKNTRIAIVNEIKGRWAFVSTEDGCLKQVELTSCGVFDSGSKGNYDPVEFAAASVKEWRSAVALAAHAHSVAEAVKRLGLTREGNPVTTYAKLQSIANALGVALPEV